MHVVLWDTRRNDIQKDFAGGLGMGLYSGQGGARGRQIRRWFMRDYRPVAMNFAFLAAIFKRLGHTVEYSLDEVPTADLYIFNPGLITLGLEIAEMKTILQKNPSAQIIVTGKTAYALTEAFAGINVKIAKGEAEQLLWKLDDVLNSDQQVVDVGTVQDLNQLPYCDWSLFSYKKFSAKFDFTRFPTAYIQQSRGCTFTCNYCPYIIIENKTRFRDPELVADEIRYQSEKLGFRSFKFRDPLFGLDRKRALKMAEEVRKLPRKVQFSIEGRIDLLHEEVLRELKSAGLTSITVGVESPDAEKLKRYKRPPIQDQKQRDFIRLTRRLGLRTVCQFLVGFPEDTKDSILNVLHYARVLNPTVANFNVVTPYPGTEFFGKVKDQIAHFDFSKYNEYTPVMKYHHLTADQVAEYHSKCFTKYYFRSRWLKENAHLLWPVLQRFGIGLGPGKNESNDPEFEVEATTPAPTLSLPIVDLAEVSNCESSGLQRRAA